MSEWLTTGEMIDRLKRGQSAQSDGYWEVKKLENGQIVELNGGYSVQLNTGFMSNKWKINNNYVSFEEAMEANRTKKVYFHGEKGDKEKPMECDLRNLHVRRLDSLDIGEHCMYSLINGKWTIEDE